MSRSLLLNFDTGTVNCIFCFTPFAPQFRHEENTKQIWNLGNLKRHLKREHWKITGNISSKFIEILSITNILGAAVAKLNAICQGLVIEPLVSLEEGSKNSTFYPILA